MKEELSITRNKVITLQYALSNADGVIIREASGGPIIALRSRNPGNPRCNRGRDSQRQGNHLTHERLAVDTEPGSLVIQLDASGHDFFEFCTVAKCVTFYIPLQLDQDKTS